MLPVTRIELLTLRGLATVVPLLVAALLTQALSWVLGVAAEITHRLACAAALGAQRASNATWAQRPTPPPVTPVAVARDLLTERDYVETAA